MNTPLSPNKFAVAVLVVTPQGIPLVRDLKKPAPAFWKLPGGRSEGDETAEEAAIREINEEIGVTLTPDSLAIIHEEDRGSHSLVIFRVDLPVLPKLLTKGNEGEEIAVFTPSELVASADFFPNHRRVVERILKELVH